MWKATVPIAALWAIEDVSWQSTWVLLLLLLLLLLVWIVEQMSWQSTGMLLLLLLLVSVVMSVGGAPTVNLVAVVVAAAAVASAPPNLVDDPLVQRLHWAVVVNQK